MAASLADSPDSIRGPDSILNHTAARKPGRDAMLLAETLASSVITGPRAVSPGVAAASRRALRLSESPGAHSQVSSNTTTYPVLFSQHTSPFATLPTTPRPQSAIRNPRKNFQIRPSSPRPKLKEASRMAAADESNSLNHITNSRSAIVSQGKFFSRTHSPCGFIEHKHNTGDCIASTPSMSSIQEKGMLKQQIRRAREQHLEV